MNEKEIIKYFMMKIREKADDCISMLNSPKRVNRDMIRVFLKDIKHYAKIIIE